MNVPSKPNTCTHVYTYIHEYVCTKVVAERRAWELAHANGLDLVVVNPGA
jgi:nucleoside-diphosphate-sugar epimerase